jgi:2,5-diketo-D-gluconate reductase A
VKDVASKHGATPAQIVLAWHLNRGTIAIPKSSTPERMRENLEAVAFNLTPAEMDSINQLETGSRIGSDPATASHTQL